jgi:hypothetical protein
MPQIPFVGASYRERSKNLDAQACINLFPVVGESGTAKAVSALYSTPGTRPLVLLDDAPVRGMRPPTDGSALIVVSGSTVYRVKAGRGITTVVTKIGTIEAGTTPVAITDNGTQAVIVTGASGYLVDLLANTVTKIVDDAFYGASSADILATFAIFNRPGTNQFYISGSNDITFDALDFASAESNAEPIVRLLVSHSDIVIFKKTVTEIWRASGDVDFPFARDTNAAIEQGCAAPWSAVSMDNSVFWVGAASEGGGIVWRLNGYTPVRVSTDAVEYAIASYADISDAVGYAYQQEGHTFYVLTFPSAGATWVYDAATQMWHQRAYLNPSTGKLGRHRSNCHAYYAGLHIVGDYLNRQPVHAGPGLLLRRHRPAAVDPRSCTPDRPGLPVDRAQPPADRHGGGLGPGIGPWPAIRSRCWTGPTTAATPGATSTARRSASKASMPRVCAGTAWAARVTACIA